MGGKPIVLQFNAVGTGFVAQGTHAQRGFIIDAVELADQHVKEPQPHRRVFDFGSTGGPDAAGAPCAFDETMFARLHGASSAEQAWEEAADYSSKASSSSSRLECSPAEKMKRRKENTRP